MRRLLRISRLLVLLSVLAILLRWCFVQVRVVRLARTDYTTPPIGPGDVVAQMRRIVVSDLHLGCGDHLEDFDADHDFADFVAQYVEDGEPVELILAGDTFEFLQVRLPDVEDEDWSETAALRRFEAIIAAHPLVIQALARFTARATQQLTLLIGNHDFELHYPAVKERLRAVLGLKADSPRLRFGISYHGGGMYLVHGNQFDHWNRFINFDGISEPFEVVRGTQMVKEIYNDLEDAPIDVAHLIDNVKPSSAYFWYLVGLPRLRQRETRRFVVRGVLRFCQVMAWPPPHHMPITGRGPGGMLSLPPFVGLWRWIAGVRRQRVARQRELARQVSVIAHTVVAPDEILTRFRKGAHRQLRREMKEFHDKFALEMLRLARSAKYGSNRLFVCGHTHLARVVSLGVEQQYINTGTWTEVIYDLATMRRQEQRYPFLEVSYPSGDAPHAQLLVWRGSGEPPQAWNDGVGTMRRRRVRLRPLPSLISGLGRRRQISRPRRRLLRLRRRRQP